MTLPKHLENATILQNRRIADGMYEITLSAPTIAQEAKPGQFLHVQVSDAVAPLLRRPISIADVTVDRIMLIYRVIGKGTEVLAKRQAGETISLLGPLGHGFPTDELMGKKVLLIGGGVGIAPLIYVANTVAGSDILMGGRTRSDLFWTSYYGSCEDIFITTDDGTMGMKGFTVDALPQILADKSYDAICTCGPEIMMKRVAQIAREHQVPCYVSLEKHMACGLGACLSCTCEAKDGTRKKVCTYGPVFRAEEVF